jgi:hypothetical protein
MEQNEFRLFLEERQEYGVLVSNSADVSMRKEIGPQGPPKEKNIMSGEATRRQQDTPNSPKNTQEESDQRFPGRQDEGRQPNPEKDRDNPNKTDQDINKNRQNKPGQDKDNSHSDDMPRR